jgi:hypothetical protein
MMRDLCRPPWSQAMPVPRKVSVGYHKDLRREDVGSNPIVRNRILEKFADPFPFPQMLQALGASSRLQLLPRFYSVEKHSVFHQLFATLIKQG